MNETKLNPENLKWQKLLWSVVAVFALGLLLSYPISKSQEGLLGFFIIMAIWFISIGLSTLCIIFRLLRVIKKRDSFIYIFACTLGLSLGIIYFYMILFKGGNRDPWWLKVFIAPILPSIVIFIDAFLKELPDLGSKLVKN